MDEGIDLHSITFLNPHNTNTPITMTKKYIKKTNMCKLVS